MIKLILYKYKDQDDGGRERGGRGENTDFK